MYLPAQLTFGLLTGDNPNGRAQARQSLTQVLSFKASRGWRVSSVSLLYRAFVQFTVKQNTKSRAQSAQAFVAELTRFFGGDNFHAMPQQ
jgi:hypothetical protein